MAQPRSGTDAIRELNDGLKILEEELKSDDTAAQRVQLLIIRLGDDDQVSIIQDWTDAMDFRAPTIRANGRTPLGKAMRTALDKIEEQKENYRSHDIPYNRPWIFVITDGEPTDLDWEESAADCRLAEDENKVVIFAVGTQDANFDALKSFSNREPVRLDGLKFRELFVWLSRSVSSGSKASRDSEVQLPAVDWGKIST
jgi:uncharacterized protein YegL|tara:strand:- start:255 stop:851 length:597 start_codon:yes stop_codon:yes gene_type:complete